MAINLDKAIKDAEQKTNLAFSDEDKSALETIFSYLTEFPDSFSWRTKANRPSLYTTEGATEIAKKFIEARLEKVLPERPKTVPDPVVFLVMQEHYSHPETDKKKIENYHLEAMSSENIVGLLLEKYIDSILRKYGWVWCSGDMVKAVDFLKKGTRLWTELQIKNRSNSENSSSQSVRNNTEIRKWFRSVALSGRTRWEKFPDLNAVKSLSEEGFQQYVKQYITNHRPRES